MNIYNLHADPKQLNHYDNKEAIPSIAWILAKELHSKGADTSFLKPTFAKDPFYAYKYAKYIMKKRWPEVEPVLRQDAESAYRYARYVMQHRWPEAEEIIKKHPAMAYRYTRDFLHKRWIEAEPYIKQDEDAWRRYGFIFQDVEPDKWI